MFPDLLPPFVLKKHLLSQGICQSLGSQGMREFTKGAVKSCCESGPGSLAVSSHTGGLSNLSQQQNRYNKRLQLIKDKHCSSLLEKLMHLGHTLPPSHC